MRRAFTLIELLIVLLVIAALAAITLGVARSLIERSRAHQAEMLVHRVFGQVSGSSRDGITGRDGRIHQPYTLGQSPGETEIDGDPARYPSGHLLVARAPATYHGFVSAAGIRTNERSQPIDPWGRPLQIAWAANTYGSAGFGVWSLGRDGQTPITSWGDRTE